jgi:hypothetical protein
MSTSILYGKARVLNLSGSDLVYDAESQMNMVEAGGELVPAIDQPIRLPTNSKTKQEPGDDDPDPGGEHLY